MRSVMDSMAADNEACATGKSECGVVELGGWLALKRFWSKP